MQFHLVDSYKTITICDTSNVKFVVDKELSFASWDHRSCSRIKCCCRVYAFNKNEYMNIHPIPNINWTSHANYNSIHVIGSIVYIKDKLSLNLL